MLLAIIADTHLSRDISRLPTVCRALLAEADVILHAGDITEARVLEELEAIGPPVRAVHGNVDSPELRLRLPERLEVEVGDVRIGMVHDAGRALRRLPRLREEFPGTRAVVFGHSHIPLHEAEAGFDIFNPGSPTDRRRQPVHTMGLARATPDGGLRFEHVVLEPAPRRPGPGGARKSASAPDLRGPAGPAVPEGMQPGPPNGVMEP